MTDHRRRIVKRILRRLRLATDRFIDWRWNINTATEAFSRPEFKSRFDDSQRNESISYYRLLRYVGRAAFKTDDVFYDIGCGSGRVICYIARRRVSKVVGVELIPAYANEAKLNVHRLRGRLAPVEVRCGDAAEMDYCDGTVFFLFNPFGSETLQAVLGRIWQTTISHPRSIRFLYFNPVHSRILDASSWLKRADKAKGKISNQPIEEWVFHGAATKASIRTGRPTPCL